jgi:hypothetical protein
MADLNPALVQQVLDVSQRQWKANVHHYRQADDFWAGLEVKKRAQFTHPGTVRSAESLLKPISPDTARAGDETLPRDLIGSGEIGASRIQIELLGELLAATLGVAPATIAAPTRTIEAPFQLRRRGVETRIVAGAPDCQPDQVLVRRLAEAHLWVRQLRTGTPLSEIAGQAGHSGAYIRTRAQLAFLSPHIQAAILDGTQPPDLSLERILRTGVPLDWPAQARIFGIAR